MLGDNIKAARLSKKYSLSALAEKCNMSTGYLSDLEKNKKDNPTKNTLGKIAEALGVSVERLTGESLSSIIKNRLKELNMTTEELINKSGVSKRFFDTLDEHIPENESDYEPLDKIAKVLSMSKGVLYAAYARQEIPVYDGPAQTLEDARRDFSDPLPKDDESALLATYRQLTPPGKSDVRNFADYTLTKERQSAIREAPITMAAHNEAKLTRKENRLMAQDAKDMENE